MENLLFDGEIVLQKMQMKGGWTYALLPEVVKGGKNNFGWTKLNAVVDGFEMKNASLMPIKGGRLFLAVKAEIRKQIKKEAGDTVRIQLFGNKTTEAITEQDFHDALRDDPAAMNNFNDFPKKEQNEYLSWVFAAGNDEAIIQRIATAIDDIAAGRFCKVVGEKTKKRK